MLGGNSDILAAITGSIAANVSAIISPVEGVMQISMMLQTFKAQMGVMINNENCDTRGIDEPETVPMVFLFK